MSALRCSRAWQAEALVDQRISAEDRASFSRHARACAECAREVRELGRLHELAARLPWAKSEPLQRRRQRNELLRRAHVGEVASPSARRPRALALALCCSVVLFFAYQLTWGRTERALPTPLSFAVQAAAGSVWRQLRGGDAVRLQLETGQVAIEVGKLGARQSFVLALPDGELEVRGTRFTIDVRDQRTHRVSVSEGRVALRIHGRPELLLGVGDSWQAELAMPASLAGPRLDPAPAPAPARTPLHSPAPRSETPALVGAPAPLASLASSGSAPPVSSASAPSPSHDFANAMDSFSRGDFATAQRRFERFEQRHPRSSQVEDSLFLRAITHLRRGDRAGARRLASEYLQHYPGGFHVREAERLLERQ